MADVPYRPYNEVTPSGMPDNYQRVSADPDVFGAASGRALQGLGRTLQQSGDVLADAAVRHQAQVDENTATDASTAFMEKASALYGDFSQKQGREAYDAFPAYKKQLDDLWNQSVAGMQSPQAKRLFTQGTRRLYVGSISDGQDYAGKQFRAWGQDAAQGRADAFANKAAAPGTTPTQMLGYMGAGADEIRKKGESQGLPPEAINSDILKYQGSILSTAITIQSQNDPQGAMATFNAYGNYMDAETRARIGAQLKPLAKNQEAQAIANVAMGVQNPTGARGSQAAGPAGYANNVGNLKVSGADWIGKGSPYNGFETFSTPEQGVAAAVKNVQHIADVHGGSVSFYDLFSTWAPGSDNNDPEAYAATVAKAVGMDPEDDVPTGNADKMTKLVKAMARVEKGAGADQVPDSAYTAGVRAAIDGTPLPNSGAVPTATASPDGTYNGLPDKSSAIQAAITMAGNDPDLLASAVSEINQRYSLHDALTATARKQLADQLPDVMRAAEQGDTSVTLPIGLMRQGMAPADFDSTVKEFDTAKRIGTLTQGLAFAPEQDLSAALSDAEGLTGPIGDAINAAAGGPAGTGDQAMRLALQHGAVVQIQRLQTDRQQMLTGDNADPAAYVAKAPGIVTAQQQLVRASETADRVGDPSAATGAAQDYAAAVLGQQAAMGVPPEKQHILTRDQRAKLAAAVNPRPGQSGEVAVQAIRGLAQSWGAAWPQVATELGKDLNDVARTIAIMPTSQNLAAAHLAEAASGRDELEKRTGGQMGADIKTSVATQFGDFLGTFGGAGVGGLQEGLRLASSGELLTRYHVAFDGMTPGDAAKQAYTEIVGSQYNVTGGVRIPIPYDGTMVVNGAEATVRGLGVRQTYTPQQNFDRNKAYVKPGATDFQTKLTPDGEAAFRKWVADNKVPFDPDQKGPQDYDMRGFYAALQSGDPDAKSATDQNDGKLHYPDKWKTPYHETFSRQSQYATPDAPDWNDKDQLVDRFGHVLFDDRQEKLDPIEDDLGAGSATQDQYLASVKAFHSWTNSPDGKGVVLLDQHGRPVLVGGKPLFRSWSQLAAMPRGANQGLTGTPPIGAGAPNPFAWPSYNGSVQ